MHRKVGCYPQCRHTQTLTTSASLLVIYWNRVSFGGKKSERMSFITGFHARVHIRVYWYTVVVNNKSMFRIHSMIVEWYALYFLHAHKLYLFK